MSSLSIQSLESHFPNVNDIVTINFLAIIPRHFARTNGQRIEGLWIPIDYFIKIPVESARTLPELYWVVSVTGKKEVYFAEYSHSMTLVRMWHCIEYLFGCIDRISNNNDLGHVFFDTGLVDTTPNHEKFGFSACDKGHVVYCFGQ